MKKKLKIALAAMACGCLALQASALTIGDSYTLGYINPGSPADPGSEDAYINHLVGMTTGTTDYSVLSQTYIQRTVNAFSPLDAAVYSTGVDNGFSGPTVTIDLGNTGGYEYLLAKYDGKNYGDVVWYIGGLTGTITIPSGAGGNTGTKYGISHYDLFTPGTPGTPPNVPDGGSTALMLGAALSVLGFLGLVRRKFRSV